MSSVQNVAASQHAGALGCVNVSYFSDTATHTPTQGNRFVKIQVVSDATFTTIEGNVNNLTGVVLPSGAEIYGKITSFALTSGAIIVYEGS
jgi:hypothetical protein